MKKKTAKEKRISCFFVRRDILLVAFVGNIAFLFFVVQKSATESTVMRVNKKANTHVKYAQMCVLVHIFQH